MTYNVLANCYSDSVLAKESLFAYCPPEYLDFKYRRILLVHEIKRNFKLIYNTFINVGKSSWPNDHAFVTIHGPSLAFRRHLQRLVGITII